jgi:hypothetical protein
VISLVGIEKGDSSNGSNQGRAVDSSLAVVNNRPSGD